jgi:outer membrane receptor protein involved in Fe transport
MEDTVTWLKGAHSFTMGASFSQFQIWLKNSTLAPSITFGMVANDPANGLFTNANFPGASAAKPQLRRKPVRLPDRAVSQITADARLDESTGKYVYEGTGMQRGRLREYGGYAQDQWRLRQNLTINAGVRWDVQNPFYPLNSSYTFADIASICASPASPPRIAATCSSRARRPACTRSTTSTRRARTPTNVDHNNFAPSAGVAWTPEARPGFLGS